MAKKTVVISKQIFENTFGRSTDRKQGAMVLEGIWKKKNEIVEDHSQDRGNCYCHDLTIRRQHSSVKTYFFLYVDEFLHDELKDSFIRIVRGCWIEEENRL